MSRPTPPTGVRRLVESYDTAFRAGLTVPLDGVDDPAVLIAAADAMTGPAAGLLDLLVLVAPAGDPVPERLRGVIDRVGEPLWRAALLLPRQSQSGGDVHPMRYAGSCRLNPALRGWRRSATYPNAAVAAATFPPSDARWDAVVVAAWLSENPGQLTQDGTLRKDVERRIYSALGGDPDRWALALQIGRLSGLVRAAEGRLRGFPEAVPRPVSDPAALLSDPLQSTAATLLLRVVTDEWLDLDAWLRMLRQSSREILCSPADGRYADRSTIPFDDDGWERVEGALFRAAADALHRAGVVDAHRAGLQVSAVRRPGPRPSFSPGFVLLPDGNLLVHSGELTSVDYGRLCRLAPYVDGERMHRHRLTREGVAADLAAGHRDPLEFLKEHSRTGLPPNIIDTVREWQRSATRITILTGVDVLEEDDGRLRLAPPEVRARVVDYTRPPRARFLYKRGRISIPDGWDTLGVRAVVERIARPIGREGDERIYQPELRAHTDAPALVERLRHYYGGELPGEIEALVLSSTALRARVESAWVVHLPAELAAALRRDWIAGPLLRRAVTNEEVVVAAEDVPRLRERLRELGVGWEGQ